MTKNTVTKTHRIRGHLVASTGDLDRIGELEAWFADDALPAAFPACNRKDDAPAQMVTITPEGVVQVYQRTPYPMVFEGSYYYAAGCGRDFALAAMHLGENAQKAAEVACALSSGCGNGVDTLTLEG